MPFFLSATDCLSRLPKPVYLKFTSSDSGTGHDFIQIYPFQATDTYQIVFISPMQQTIITRKCTHFQSSIDE